MQLQFSDLEQPAPVQFKCPQQQQWFNTYGGYIIETKWNPKKMAYDTIYHQYNMPNLDLMANE